MGSLAEAGPGLVLEDALGRVCQHVAEQDFLIYDPDTEREIPFHRDDGWWDMRMERRINPQHIEFPATVVWEQTNKQGA